MSVTTGLRLELCINARQSRRSSLPRTYAESNVVLVYLLERHGIRTTSRGPMAAVEVYPARYESVA